ncbi:MAG: TetR/AcrR family transcriptional regulator [Byssovorax sp.]
MDAHEQHEERRRLTGQHGARTGGRSERVVKSVLDATIAELGKAGYAALRVEDVATKAGVNKTTIYRRWPTKAELVGAALRATKGVAAPPPRGPIREVLLALARRSAARSKLNAGLIRTIMSEIDHPEVAAIFRALRDEHRAPWLDALGEALARGELPAGTDTRLLTELIQGPIMHRVRMHEPVGEAFLEGVIDVVLRGAEGGAAIRQVR